MGFFFSIKIKMLKILTLFVFVCSLPETLASAAPLLSRAGCRCAGTSQPARRSREEAVARFRSTGTAAAAAAAPAEDGGPRTPASRLFFTEQRRTKIEP